MVNEVLHALAEPRRRDILGLIQTRELSSGQIAAHFDVTQAAISQHLGLLASAGLVSVRRQGNRRLYRARPEGLAELRRYLEGFWDSQLRSLAAEAEDREREDAAREG